MFECVETEEQKQFIENIMDDAIIQGFYYSAPLSIATLSSKHAYLFL